MEKNTKNYFKFFSTLALCLLVRLIPYRAPNIEPVLAAAMPLGRAYGALAGFSFGALSIFLYDLVTGTLGVRTIFTAGAYGLVGLLAAVYFRNRKARNMNAWSYVKFAVMGTLLFDGLTGLTVGPIFFHQSFIQALSGQIPFTVLHLLGNVIFSYALSPGIYNFLVKKKKPARNAAHSVAGGEEESPSHVTILNPKII